MYIFVDPRSFSVKHELLSNMQSQFLVLVMQYYCNCHRSCCVLYTLLLYIIIIFVPLLLKQFLNSLSAVQKVRRMQNKFTNAWRFIHRWISNRVWSYALCAAYIRICGKTARKEDSRDFCGKLDKAQYYENGDVTFSNV